MATEGEYFCAGRSTIAAGQDHSIELRGNKYAIMGLRDCTGRTAGCRPVVQEKLVVDMLVHASVALSNARIQLVFLFSPMIFNASLLLLHFSERMLFIAT